MGFATNSTPVMVVKSSSFRLLIAFLIIYALLVTYGRSHFYRDPGSVFYDPERAYTRQYSDFRQIQAENFVAEQKALVEEQEDEASEQYIVKSGQNPTVCASFATMRRNGEQYIDNSIGSALVGLSIEEREGLFVSVFFANADPYEHPTYHQPWLNNLVDSIYTQPLHNETYMARIQDLEESGNLSAKGVVDYTYGLKHCYDNGAPFVLMFEGDVIIADGWFVRTMQALRDAKEKYADLTWLYMRLFNQERSIGWGSKEIGGNNEHWITMAIVAVILFMASILKKRSTSTHPYFDPWTLIVICVLIVPSFVILFFQSGKASLLPPSPGVYQESFGCCSQALLFPRDRIPGLIDYLTMRDHGQVDLMVNTYGRNEEMKRLSLYPVQAQHVGIESARGTKKDEAQAIWSMAFEDKDPMQLIKEHKDLVDSYYYGGELG